MNTVLEEIDLTQEFAAGELVPSQVPGEAPQIKGETTFPKFAEWCYGTSRFWVLGKLKNFMFEELYATQIGVIQVFGIDPDELFQLPSIVDASFGGKEWVAFATCDKVDKRAKGIPGQARDANPKGERHPRWLINFAAGKDEDADADVSKIVTPAKGVGKLLKRSKVFVDSSGKFDDEAWDAFKKIGRVTGGSGAGGKRKPPRGLMHLNPHHVVYAASETGRAKPLQDTAGKGGSISHKCDCAGCVGQADASHLEWVEEHRINVHRINCAGARLVVGRSGNYKAIVKVDLCDHAEGRVENCCRKVIVTDIGEVSTVQAALSEAAAKQA